MMVLVASSLVVASSLFASGAPVASDPSKVDVAAGWKLYSGADAPLFWRGYKQTAFPAKGWVVQNGELAIAKGGGGGDLVTYQQFADVEMAFEFKLGEKSNSGIMWHVAEKHDTTWQTGPEYQLLEDASFGAKPTDMHSCGALYDLYSPAAGKTMKPAGEWNSGRLRLRNGVLQHWLNGSKVVETRVFDDAGKPTKEWADKIAASKFASYEGFGVLPAGSIAIQDHGDTDLALRNVLIRDLAAPLSGEEVLFDGKSMDAWQAFVPDLAKDKKDQMAVWEVKDGVLICKGNPGGYIHTKKDYKNFVMRLEWRFNPVTKQAGNSGVLFRMVGDHKVWPKSVEAQLQSGSAGDFWNIENVKMSTEKARLNGRNTKHTHAAERPLGEWNEYEIIVNKGDVILKVNGEELNRAWDVEEVAGKICLQSEGTEIHFRNIRVVPLD